MPEPEKGTGTESDQGNAFISADVYKRQALQCGLQVRGISGFFLNRKKNWDIAFPKDSGILFPVPDEDGLYQALQIRMDEEKSGRKYLWLSSAGYPHGVSSRSVAAYFGDMDGEVAVTEGALKAYCAWCFSGKPFIGIPGVGQTACLESFLQEKEGSGLRVLECMDMDKWMPVVCDRKERHCLDLSLIHISLSRLLSVRSGGILSGGDSVPEPSFLVVSREQIRPEKEKVHG